MNYIRLKQICEIIWYKPPYLWYQSKWIISNADMFSEVPISEIIFSQPFMNKFIEYTENKISKKLDFRYVLWRILENLDNPIKHLDFILKISDNKTWNTLQQSKVQ